MKIDREQLMSWSEDFVNDFNSKEHSGELNSIYPCLTKIGQNIFQPIDDSFENWLNSLCKNALYKSLLEAQTAEIL